MKLTFRNIFLQKYTLLAISAILFAFSIIFNTLYTSRSSVLREVRVAENYLQDQQKDFNEFTRDAPLLRKLIRSTTTIEEFYDFTAKNYSIFIYTISNAGNWGLANWNSQLIVPSSECFGKADGGYFLHMANGYYFVVKRTVELDGSPTLVFALMLVRSDFFLETEYLPQRFAFSHLADRRVTLSEKPTNYPVRELNGEIAYYLNKRVAGLVPYNDQLTIILRLSAVLFLFLFFARFAEFISTKKQDWMGVVFLACSLVSFRVVTYIYPWILNLRQFDLFDPSHYGSNLVQRSLGDLLINSVLFCWIIIFAWSKLRNLDERVRKFPMPVKWLVGMISLCLLIGSTLILATTIRSMVTDSKISFDVIDFFSLDEYTIVGFIVLASLSLSYYYFTQLLFRLILPLFSRFQYLIYFAIAFTGLVYLTLLSGNAAVLFYLPVLVWLLIYVWLVSRQGHILSRIRINIAGILFWISVFSVSIAAVMLAENKKAEWNRRKVYAEKQAVQTDPSSERMLNIALTYIDNDFLTDNFVRFGDKERSQELRDSIINENYKGYLNKFETKLFVFDSLDNGLNNEDATPYSTLNNILSVHSKPTAIPGLYFYETAFDKFVYLTKRVVTDPAGKKTGTVFIISNPRNYKSDALLPELFKQFKQIDPENSPVYSYAIYNDTTLVTFSTKYPFHTTISHKDLPQQEFERKKNGEYDELWYRATNKKVVVMARKQDTVIETITLFSYIFCSFLFLVFLVQLISAMLKLTSGDASVKKIFQWNIRSQVHGTIIFISVLSFVIIGIATISFFITRYNRNNNDKLSRTMKIMVNEMQKKLMEHGTFDDVIPIYDSVASNGLQTLVDEISDIHGVDVNVYNLKGSLQVSSQANVYNKGVLSKKMNPVAYYHLNRMEEIQHIQKEEIGSLSYFSIYAPVRDDKGAMSAYLNIPYFASQPELNQEIANFLVTIINLNAFIFLIAGLIALFITNRITSSFSLISDKMRKVNLGKMNEAIAWSREDEIGELVIEYNKMVAKLGESAIILAKSEREGAWREMARQVAHEIKNPLTPMKLSIQYLQKAIDSNLPNVKELSSRVANTLVEQIDHLSKIAADFSQFANIGNTNVEVLDLHEVIGSLKELYEPDHNVVFEWSPVNNKIMVAADKTQMNRLFTNLFANAVEACNGNVCKIEVMEEQQNGNIVISVKDNGEGIAPEMQSRIFIPNFTTKSSGTGLGLAMCKGIVEHAKGRIWFETGTERGTTFHVELPLAN